MIWHVQFFVYLYLCLWNTWMYESSSQSNFKSIWMIDINALKSLKIDSIFYVYIYPLKRIFLVTKLLSRIYLYWHSVTSTPTQSCSLGIYSVLSTSEKHILEHLVYHSLTPWKFLVPIMLQGSRRQCNDVCFTIILSQSVPTNKHLSYICVFCEGVWFETRLLTGIWPLLTIKPVSMPHKLVR